MRADKVVLITGGSRGIGAATALLAAQRGYAVALSYRRDRTAAERVVARIESQNGRALAVPADVASEHDVLQLFAQTDARLGRLCALVNNAGMLETRMRLNEMSADRMQRVFAVNLTGSFPLRARGGAAHVDASRRTGWRYRQSQFARGQTRGRWQLCRLRGVEGSD